MSELEPYKVEIFFQSSEVRTGAMAPGYKTPEELARSAWYDWWDYRFGPEPEVTKIEVNGVEVDWRA